jgi:rubrerythrin
MAAMTQERYQTILMDIAKEEKTHVGEFQTLLLRLDKEQERELEEGRKEVEEITKTKSK